MFAHWRFPSATIRRLISAVILTAVAVLSFAPNAAASAHADSQAYADTDSYADVYADAGSDANTGSYTHAAAHIKENTDPATRVSTARVFDIQAHRGGLGYVVESTLPAFRNAIRLGVTTLELDIQITKDRHAVVTHDRQVSPDKCVSRKPVKRGDKQFPYTGKFIKDLTLRQVRSMDCGSKALESFPSQRTVPGSKMPLLSEVLQLGKENRGIRFNIETKVEVIAPWETAPREQFVDAVIRQVNRFGLTKRVVIQSFDWSSLRLVHKRNPKLQLAALVNLSFPEFGKPGRSPWLGGLDIDDFHGNIAAAAKVIGASILSPVQGDPQEGKIGDPSFRLLPNAAYVKQAHQLGLKVIPWTVDDPATMQALIDAGVDGIITNYPERLRAVLKKNGYMLPAPGRPDFARKTN